MLLNNKKVSLSVRTDAGCVRYCPYDKTRTLTIEMMNGFVGEEIIY